MTPAVLLPLDDQALWVCNQLKDSQVRLAALMVPPLSALSIRAFNSMPPAGWTPGSVDTGPGRPH